MGTPNGTTMTATSRERGFSMMEVIVAVAVLAMLAGVVTPMVDDLMAQKQKSRAVEDAQAIAHAIGAYYEDTGAYPPGMQADPTYNYANAAYFEYGAEVLNTWLFEGPKKYLEKPIGNDPWGSPFSYHVYTRSDPYMDVAVFSHGPNKACESWDGALWSKGKFGGDDVGAFFDFTR